MSQNRESIADTNEYKEFELRHNRHLNMVAESDRNLRRQALTEFKKATQKEKNDKILEFFYRERLCKRLVMCLEDAVEKNREIAIEIISEMVERFGFKEESQIILPAINGRMTKLPYAETSEEVRVQLIELLEVCLESDPQMFVPNAGQLCSMLAKAAADPNPDMKNKVASFAGKLAVALDRKVGSYFKATIDALTLNLQHQHSKVRKQTLNGLMDVVSAAGAEPFLEGGPLVQLKFTMNDRSQDVRAKFYDVLFHWMKKIELHYLRVYEPTFIQFLLNGIADDKLDIGPKCIQYLEEHSKRMRDALKALGEDEEEDNDTMKDEQEINFTTSLQDSKMDGSNLYNIGEATKKQLEQTSVPASMNMEEID